MFKIWLLTESDAYPQYTPNKLKINQLSFSPGSFLYNES